VTRPGGRDASGSLDINSCHLISLCFCAAGLYMGGRSVLVSGLLAPLHSEA
jgi:hypothetical protein